MVIRLPKIRWISALAKATVVALLATSFASASDSGVLSYRAKRSFDSGKFAKGYGQLERALLASRKEADLLSEGRILLAMAQIRTMSMDYALADSLISIVRDEALDKNTRVLKGKVKMAIANERKDYKAAASICDSFSEDVIKRADETTQAAFYGECAIAQAGTHKDPQESLKMAGKRSDKKGGFYAFTAARIAEINGDMHEADSLYKVAEKKSIEGNKPYNTATILYIRSQLKTTPKDEAEDMKIRCKNAFELMGLPNNAKRCDE